MAVGQINSRHQFLTQLIGAAGLKKKEVLSFEHSNLLQCVVLTCFVVFGLLEGLFLFIYLTRVCLIVALEHEQSSKSLSAINDKLCFHILYQ